MLTSHSSLLFATNLSQDCKPALVASVQMAAHYKANYILLHVIESDVPGHYEEHFKGMLGKEKWEALKQEHEQDARHALIGKMTPDKMGQKALSQYCAEAGIDKDDFEFNWKEVVVADKNIVDAILTQAEENNCGVIVLGAKKNLWGGNSVGSKIKGVLKNSKIPVMVVPSDSKD